MQKLMYIRSSDMAKYYPTWKYEETYLSQYIIYIYIHITHDLLLELCVKLYMVYTLWEIDYDYDKLLT